MQSEEIKVFIREKEPSTSEDALMTSFMARREAESGFKEEQVS
jgi:hypothetical protein